MNGRTPLLNRSSIRTFALEYAEQCGRGEVITQIDREVYYYLNELVRTKLRGMVQHHPSAFRTLKP